ncbi:MAG TPA: hypothetical protein VD969_02655 [Symbiobacteriaceae bacterium]|nr:hypothetical protein [Symbiobacteriaceae bacterium]
MDDKLEITLRITLNRPGLERQFQRKVENDTAFYILGMIHAQLSSTFGDDHCLVEMESATGLNPDLVRAMNSFPRRHKRALDALEAWGEAVVEDRDVLEVFQTLHNVMITPLGAGKWRVTQVNSTIPYHHQGEAKN